MTATRFDAIDERLRRFTPTPGLREKVISMVEETIAAGFKITPRHYVQDGRCCVIGAISVAVDMPDQGVRGLRWREESYLLSIRELGCHPIELDSIEAGFENWHWGDMRAETAASPQTLWVGSVEPIAYAIGQEVRIKYAGMDGVGDWTKRLLNEAMWELYDEFDIDSVDELPQEAREEFLFNYDRRDYEEAIKNYSYENVAHRDFLRALFPVIE